MKPEFAIGDTIRAYTSRPAPDGEDSFIEGEIQYIAVEFGVLWYFVACRYDNSTSSTHVFSRVGKTIRIPVQVPLEYPDRLTFLFNREEDDRCLALEEWAAHEEDWSLAYTEEY